MGLTWNTFKTKGSCFGTYLTNDSSGWVCGYFREVYYTKNYGKSWHLMNCGIEGNSNMDDLWFINDSTGFVCGQGGIYKLEKKEDSISITGDSTICKKYAILKADRDFEKYEWYQITSQGDTIPINKKNKEAVIENAGKYIVKGIHIDDCYYVYSDPFTISIGAEKPNITMDIHCFGDTISFYINNGKGGYANLLGTIIEPSEDIIEYALIGKETANNTPTYYKFFDYTDTIKRVGFIYGSVEEDCVDTLWFDIKFKERIKPILRADGKTTFCDNVDRILYIENAKLFTDNTWYLEEKEIAKNVPSHKPTQSGTYKVIASNNGHCLDSSDAITITITDERDALRITTGNTALFMDSVNYGKQSYKKFIIHNISDKVFVLNDVIFRYKFAFTTPMSQFPITILPLDSTELIIYYSPTNLGWQYDTIYINDNCSIWDIPLSGFGKGNIDSTTGTCDIMITISTHSITQAEIVKLGTPIPNPIDSKGKISYKIIIETAGNIENKTNNISNNWTFQLYDLIGTPIDIPHTIEEKNVEIINKTEIHNGEINFDMKKIYPGVYFIRISYGSATKVFSIIKG